MTNYTETHLHIDGTEVHVPRCETRSIVVPVLPCDNFTVTDDDKLIVKKRDNSYMLIEVEMEE